MPPKKGFVVGFVFLFVFMLFSDALWARDVGGDDDNPFLLSFEEGPIKVRSGESVVFNVHFSIPPGHYLYEDKISIELEPSSQIKVGQLDKPEAISKKDPFLGEIVSVYYNEVDINLNLIMPEPMTNELLVKGKILFQGCSSDLCYRPMRIPFELSYLPSDKVTTQVVSTQKNNPVEAKEKGVFQVLAELSITDYLQQKNYVFSFLIAFIGGILSDFTPCVWPMIPVTLIIIGVRRDKTVRHNVMAVFVMVLGMAVMYSLLGVLSAFLGKSLGFLFQQQFFLWLIVAVMITMGLSLLGLFEFKLPPRFLTWLSTVTATGYRGIFLIGFTMGILAAPCVGPIIGSILVYVAQTQDVFFGFWLLLFYALGMGSLFLVVAALYKSIQLKSKSGTWLVWFKRFLGLLVIGLAIYYALIALKSGPSTENKLNGFWEASYEEGIAKANKTNKPVLIDFYAAWCLPCKELDHLVWENPSVIEEVKKDFVAIHIDCTTESRECKEAVDQYKIIGWPTVLFLRSDQSEVRDERLVGKVISASEMLEIMKRVKAQ